MSTIIMARCWPLKLPAVAKAVLISLADQANDQGVCWPSIQTISVRVCCCERAVRNALRTLEEVGLLDVEIGAMRANRYTLRPERYKTLHSSASTEEQEPAPNAGRNNMPPGTTFLPPRHHVPPNHHRTDIKTPPLPPKGGELSCRNGEGGQTSASSRIRGKPITLAEWLDGLKAIGEKPIPPNHAIFDYCDAVGITEEMILLHWAEFKARNLENGIRQTDWRRKLFNSIKGCWYRLWYVAGDGAMQLSTQGQQALRAHRAKGGRHE